MKKVFFKYFFVLGSIILGIFLAEMGARLSEKFAAPYMFPKTDSNYYVKKVMYKYPQLLKDYFGPCPATYHDYYYMSVKKKTKTINTTDYYDTRLTPDSASLGSTEKIVWMFGGSTLVNFTAPDELTITNQVAVNLNKDGQKVIVVNFGMGGFASSQELIKFVDLLRRVSPIERPRVVIFYDGYNDAAQSFTFGPGNLQEDIAARFKFLVEDQTMLLPSIFSSWMSQHLALWRKFAAPLIQEWYLGVLVKQRPASQKNPEESVALYERNVQIIRAISKQFGIQPIFVLQPMIFTKTPLTDMEKEVLKNVVDTNKPHADYMRSWFEITGNRMANSSDFLDLTQVLNGRVVDDFVDHGHTAPETGIAIAKPLAERINGELTK